MHPTTLICSLLFVACPTLAALSAPIALQSNGDSSVNKHSKGRFHPFGKTNATLAHGNATSHHHHHAHKLHKLHKHHTHTQHTNKTQEALTKVSKKHAKIVKSKKTKTPKTHRSNSTSASTHKTNSTTSATTNLSTFAKQMLSGHNALRKKHDADPLTWNAAAATAAKVWAKKCVFQHGGGVAGHYGENIAAGYSTVAGVVKAWGVDEEPAYKVGTYSHYTQMVWKATTSVGCAVVECDGILQKGITSAFYVCEYDPAGNVVGQDSENVS